MFQVLSVLDTLLLSFATLCLVKLISRGKQRYPYPPGPKGLPVIGNLLDFPSEKGWEVYAKWGNQYGEILRLNALGQSFVVINDLNTAFEMLDKKGTIYADRPQTTMLELSGWSRILGCQLYGARVREFRKFIAKVVGTSQSIKKFYPIVEHHSNMFLKRLLDNPKELEHAIRKAAGAITMRVTYGYDIKEDGRDYFVDLAEDGLAQFSRAATPGRYLVDLMPFLKYIPSWFPGAGFQKAAKGYHQCVDKMAEMPMRFVRAELDQGRNSVSFAGDLLMNENLTPEKLYNIQWAAASFYSGGADTTIGTTLCYFLAMTVYPEVQNKLHEEMDAVVGCERLPTFADRASLPYLEAVCKELYRWMPIAPLGLPHQASVDDIHNGYFIKKGTIVVANAWKILHDPSVYSDPFTFNPNRFLGPNPERNPKDIGFGFGRRICPGLHLADAIVWSSVCKAAFGLNVSKALDAYGKPIEPVIGQLDGIISRPIPFECCIQARDKHVRDLLKDFETSGLMPNVEYAQMRP